jgi:ABC-2 type transport system permease protein
VAAAVGVLGFLINGFAPLIGGLEWLKYFSLFYYYSGHDPIGAGVHLGDLAVLAAVTLAGTAAAAWWIDRRDLR